MIKHCKISLVIGITLVITAFVPIIQIILMTLNGGFLSLFTDGNETKTIYIVNLLGSILSLVLYYYSNKTAFKILNSIAFLFFFYPYFRMQLKI